LSEDEDAGKGCSVEQLLPHLERPGSICLLPGLYFALRIETGRRAGADTISRDA